MNFLIKLVELLSNMALALGAQPAEEPPSNMPKPTIAVINASTVLSDNDVTPVVQALQMQVSLDYAPISGRDANLVQIRKGQHPPKGSWWLTILDSSDQAGALGYHDITNEELPLGKVFAGTDLQYGNLWSVTASHELLEMLGDPGINDCRQGPDGLIRAYENCDAVEADDLGYFKVLKDGHKIKVSDWVYDAWFGNVPPVNSKYDFCGHLKNPLELASGGYIGVLDPTGGGWGIQTAKSATAKTVFSSRAPVGSRRERRRTERQHWLVSTAHTPEIHQGANV